MNEQTETTTIRTALLESLFDQLRVGSYDKGFREGMDAAKSLEIGEHLGSTDYVTVLYANSRRGLSRKLKEEYPGGIDTGCGHDCSGRVCGRYGTILRTLRYGDQWAAVVLVTIAIDV